jgi:hypothetical protein
MRDVEAIDIWRAANLMIEMFAEDATLKAAMRADALLAEGDTEGFVIWKRIAKAIHDLHRQSRAPEEQCQ